jgi:hypothetical protein
MRWWLGTMAAVMVAGTAHSQPITRPLIESGYWSTVEQVPAASAAPDACMIVQADTAVALRSIGHVVDLMVANAHWDLPRVMQGALLITLDGEAESFPISYTTRDTAVARIDGTLLPSLLDAMSHDGTMRVMLFPGMPVLVPLAGFAGALPAFRHCARLT